MAGSEYYNHTTYPAFRSQGSSSTARAEFQAIKDAFGKCPALSGNGGKIVAVNSGGTALEAVTTTGTGNAVRATAPTFTLTDVTTNNASTSQHGWMPKLTGSTLTYFRSDGTQSNPSTAIGVFHVREQLADGVNSGPLSDAGFTNRTLNTTVTNTITGASLASNKITLPAGTFDFVATATAYVVNGAAVGNRHKASIYNNTDSTTPLVGSSEAIIANMSTRSEVKGRVTIAAAKDFYLRHYTLSVTPGSVYGGIAVISGLVEVYCEVYIEQIA